MNAPRVITLALLPVITFTFGGCQSNGEPDGMSAAPTASIVFVPRVRRATVQSAEGRYPNLFTPASHAIWGADVHVEPALPAPTPPEVTSDATEAAMDSRLESVPIPAEVEASRAGGLTIECHLESEFPDRSIAYDAVGLRGMTVALQLPDGREIQPAQKTLAAELEEVPVGALRRYGRKLTLYFSESQFMVENPAMNPKAGGIRLVLQGIESEFYFEWAATPDFLSTPAPRLDQQAARVARKHLRTTREAVSRASHNFD